MNRGIEIFLALATGFGIGAVVGGLIGGTGWLVTGEDSRRTITKAVPLEAGEQPQGPVQAKIIGSGISNPGTYEMESDSEVIDLISRAGGLTRGAVIDGIPWNETLYEGFSISIPTREVLRQVEAGERSLRSDDLMYFRGDPNNVSTDTEPENSDGININQADRDQLQELYGVGPGLAGRIVQHRERHGPFEIPADIKEVPGIGEVTFQQMRPDIEL